MTLTYTFGDHSEWYDIDTEVFYDGEEFQYEVSYYELKSKLKEQDLRKLKDMCKEAYSNDTEESKSDLAEYSNIHNENDWDTTTDIETMIEYIIDNEEMFREEFNEMFAEEASEAYQDSLDSYDI